MSDVSKHQKSLERKKYPRFRLFIETDSSLKGILLTLEETREIISLDRSLQRISKRVDHAFMKVDLNASWNWKLRCFFKYFRDRRFYTYIPSLLRHRCLITEASKNDVYFFQALKKISSRKWKVWANTYLQGSNRTKMIEILKPYVLSSLGRKENG